MLLLVYFTIYHKIKLFCKTVRWRMSFSGGKRCTTAVSTPLLTSHTPSGREDILIFCFMNEIIKMKFAFLGSTRRGRCHRCSKPRAGDFKEKHKHSKNCQDLFQISVHKVNLLKKVSHTKSKRKKVEDQFWTIFTKTECQITKAMSG